MHTHKFMHLLPKCYQHFVAVNKTTHMDTHGFVAVAEDWVPTYKQPTSRTD